ncbi:MAG: carboxylating nicotinate-nucleotide diphosphorylase [Tatlockia sp.]|jgi:nicotinate-nucleotide pyrophosphorylase (carboxylating)
MKIKHSDVLVDVIRALEEDVGTGDISAALLPAQLTATVEIISREPMLVCGRPWVDAVFKQMHADTEVNWLVQEGEWLQYPTTLCQIKGNAAAILTAERTALNFLQTLSATASQVYLYLQQLKGSKTQLLDTRKTIPGLRLAQKYAVACAGAKNHRLGLYDAFLIKENHIKACGSITKAIEKARKMHHSAYLEVEVESLDELAEALLAKPDRILLDNFSKLMLTKAVEINQSHQCELEASGGIDLSNIVEIAQTGVNYISVGAMTKSIKAIDLSLLIKDVK